ncbi:MULTISPECIES: molecular chaperone HtpG [Rhodanobacter]|uniref:molecular chaperone HtpG n=1 Tax=Rhodanobacter TaxID=75309 RepID=UPI000402CFF6|nr:MULTISPECIES: molecular chaperone HtpG [Rhodanobacter]KZC18608.1 molecular chaperone HtpG [Rhodanobacter denitrificans]UJJ49930.1 molecular chaperone HtpG [Rhodanobacter denitrificans]UJJ57879.1 molecular chaperone HtpG [Rhodanobacter denitrificans]UJM92643.1 molecular chaperone HtpG [Rhodanobacter denitrificans]UJM96173.1 molecular chaperone HtpG [Rhodanobacter denitrificans]
MNAPAETRKFEAEVAQVLHLVTHSLYSHKEIFLRELISNASDACDKLRFESIAKPELSAGDSELHIDVSWDPAARTVTVRDNGIGMNRDEVVANIGTIASSGTRRFLEAMSGEQKADARLIGQFGVGFYSAFVVADKVTVLSRRADAPAGEGVKWESDGKGEYSLEPVELAERGTAVILHLKADEDEFLSRWQLRALITRYSDHVAFPIRMPVEKDGKPTDEFETINAASALWTKPKSEISDEDYQSFYKSLGHDFNDALAWTHNRVEGSQSFTTLLYIPSQPPFDLMMGGRDERKGVKLYIKRVFIMDAAEELLPNYLRFVRGVVDADDLPLNVSREILQHNRQLERIKAACVKRVLDLIEKLAKDEPEKFATFYKAFGNTLKEGISEDANNRERIAKLLRFASTKGEGSQQTVALDDYIGRMAVGQDAIWYITADSYAAAFGSPQLEAFKAKDIEVLLMSDRIDEWMIGSLSEYEGKKLKSVAKGEVPLDEAGKKKQEEATKEAAPLLKKLKDLLGDRVADVKVSARLTDSPSCLALSDYEMAPHLARLLREAGHEMPENKPTLEINPQHALLKRVEAEADEAKAKDLATLLLEQAEIAAGAQLPDPSAFVQRMNRVLLG